MKHEVVFALKNSLVGDNLSLKNSNIKLSEISKYEGYCMCLMEIIDEPNFDTPTKQAALIQLKNIVKAKWKPTALQPQQMTLNEKSQIKNALILAIIRCSNQYMLIKLYREVLTNVIQYEYQNWTIIEDLITRLKAGESLVPVFHCIMAICTNFQKTKIKEEQKFFNSFLKDILPAVFENVKNNLNNSELVYLSLKILWKAVQNDDLEQNLKILMNPWMQLILLTITTEDEQMQKKLSQIQNKNTPEFYYYHSKKWATRILLRFVSRHSKGSHLGLIHMDNFKYSTFWYQTYGPNLCQSILQNLELGIPTTKKVRYFQLKIIQAILQDKPHFIHQYSKHFQYQLIKYMNITPQDEIMAHDVIEYFRTHDDTSENYSNVKKAAMDIWKFFMQFKSELDMETNCYIPGPFFDESMQFMLAKLSSQDLLDKQLGMFLFCENQTTILQVPAIQAKIQNILQKYIVPELINPAILIRAKANDMLYKFGKQITNMGILTKSIEALIECLTQDESPLVRVKAAIALNPIISNQNSKQLLQPYIKQILEIYLKLIEQYDLQQLVQALEHFINHFSQSISPFAIDLFKYLSGIFIMMCNKDMEISQNGDYNEVKKAACSCMETMAQILKAPLDPHIRSQLEPSVLQICTFIFTQQQSLDYTNDAMLLMKVYMEKVDKMSNELWFFFQVLIYFVAGIPQQIKKQIQNPSYPDKKKSILSNIRTGNSIQLLHIVVSVLRNYFNKSYSMITKQKQQFKANFINLVFYLVNFVVSKGRSNNCELYLNCSTILLVYLLETFPSQMTKQHVQRIWIICYYNLLKLKTELLKKITAQLLSVLLWKHPLNFIEILSKEGKLHVFINNICDIAPNLKKNQQRKRVIFGTSLFYLGICSYFSNIGQNLEVLSQFAPNLFHILLKMVDRNSQNKTVNDMTDQEQKDSDSIKDDDEENDDPWNQEQNQNNISKLQEINELQVFRNTMQNLNIYHQHFYEGLVNIEQKHTQTTNLNIN